MLLKHNSMVNCTSLLKVKSINYSWPGDLVGREIWLWPGDSKLFGRPEQWDGLRWYNLRQATDGFQGPHYGHLQHASDLSSPEATDDEYKPADCPSPASLKS
jgi:hypothetical protein